MMTSDIDYHPAELTYGISKNWHWKVETGISRDQHLVELTYSVQHKLAPESGGCKRPVPGRVDLWYLAQTGTAR